MGTTITTWSRACFYWLARALHLQLFLTLFSLPILVAWGLPISLASPLGNLVFTPFLTLFLLLSSLIFFGELLHLPYGLCAYLLDHVTSTWITCMNYGDTQWLVGVQRLPMPLLILAGVAPLVIVACKRTRSLQRSTFCFVILLTSMYGYARCTNRTQPITTIACGRGELTLLTTPTTTVLIDPGYLGSSVAAASWARYTLIPHLISTTGTTHIHHLIMLQPMGLGFEAAEQLCALLRIDTLYVPYWQGDMQRSHLKRYGNLKQTAHATQTRLVRNGTQELTITLSDTARITLTPHQKTIRTGDITYAAYELVAQIDNQKVTIYSAKAKKGDNSAQTITQ